MLLIELISISNMGVSLIETCFCSRLYSMYFDVLHKRQDFLPWSTLLMIKECGKWVCFAANFKISHLIFFTYIFPCKKYSILQLKDLCIENPNQTLSWNIYTNDLKQIHKNFHKRFESHNSRWKWVTDLVLKRPWPTVNKTLSLSYWS